MKKIPEAIPKERINLFFSSVKDKKPEEIRKIKRFAMSKKIPLKEKRKLFCKKCFTPYTNPKIRVRKGVKTLICQNCGYGSRWKIKPS